MCNLIKNIDIIALLERGRYLDTDDYFYNVTSQQSQNICIAFIQRRPDVFDVGQTLYKCYTNVLSLCHYNGILQLFHVE